MGLIKDIENAKLEGAKFGGSKITEATDSMKKEAELTAAAIVKFLTSANFTITQLKAPVIVESLKTPEQLVNIELDTLLGEWQPVLKVLKKIGNPLGLDKVIDQLETQIEKAITPLLEGGAKLAGLDLGKDSGGLESTGYVYIGEDPDSQEAFDVDGEDGQRDFTTVKLIEEDIEELL